jgi:hypothetical protein
MKRTSFVIALALSIMLTLSACQPSGQTPTATNAPATAAPNSLSLNDFNNGEVFGWQSQRSVQLTNGKFEGGSGADYLMLQILPQAAFGDITGDGKADAVLLYDENMGGSGVFVSLTGMIATASGFTQTNSILVDDRPLINSVQIQDGKVVLNATIHNITDAMADPTEQVIEKYEYANGNLVLTSFSSTIGGAERTIQIDTPAAGDTVSGSVTVKGSMPIAPFENTLVYHLYDQSNSLIAEGPFMVTAADVGAPATFNNSIALPTNLTSGAKIRLELAELSMADGSTLCMNSVDLVVK